MLGNYASKDFHTLSYDEQVEYIKLQVADIYAKSGLGMTSTIVNLDDDDEDRISRVRYCRAVFNDSRKITSYNYLYNQVNTKVKKVNAANEAAFTDVLLEMPAKIRHIPVVKPMLQAIHRAFTMMPIIPDVSSPVDSSYKSFVDRLAKEVIGTLELKVKERLVMHEYQKKLAEAQAELLAAKMNVQDPELRLQLQTQYMQVSSALQLTIDRMNSDLMLQQEDLLHITKYAKNFKEVHQRNARKLVMWYLHHKGIKREVDRYFQNKLIHDEPMFFVDWQPGMPFVEFKSVNAENVAYEVHDDQRCISDSRWVILKETHSLASMVENYTPDAETLKEFKTIIDQEYNGNVNYGIDRTAPNGQYYSNARAAYSANKVTANIFKVYLRMETPVWVLVSKNKHGSNRPPFVKMLEKEEAIEMKKNKKRLEARGQSVEKRFRVERWDAIFFTTSANLTEPHFITVGKAEFQYREPDEKANVKCPIIGPANTMYRKPYSLVYETIGLQELVNILYYQLHLMVIMSGVKALVYDISQKPDGFSLSEVMYYLKKGLMLIQTKSANGNQDKSKFNQFQALDNTIGNALDHIMNSIERIEQHIMFILGTNPQMMNQVQTTDQVGTFKAAVAGANQNMSYHYYDAQEYIDKALTRLVNLASECHKQGFSGEFMLGELGQTMLNIPSFDKENALTGAYHIKIAAGDIIKQRLEDAKAVAQRAWVGGQMSGSTYVKAGQAETLDDLVEILMEAEKQFSEMNQLAQSQSSQDKAQAAIAIAEAQSKFKMQADAQLAQINAQIEKQRLDIDAQLRQRESEITIEREAMKGENNLEQQRMKSATDLEEARIEERVEMAYLGKETEEVRLNDRNAKLSMILDKARNTIEQVNASSKKERVKD